MSFDPTTGIYTPPTGATNATPGTVIRSATWNTVFGDIAAALTQLGQQSFTSTVVTKTGNYTVASTDSAVIFNASATATVVMPTPSTNTGRWLRFKTIAAQSVISSATVVAPLTSATPGTTILAGTAGKWAALQSDGTNWVIIMGN